MKRACTLVCALAVACGKPTYLQVQVAFASPDTNDLGSRVSQIEFRVFDKLADAGPIRLPAVAEPGAFADGGAVTLVGVTGTSVTVLLNGWGASDAGPIASGSNTSSPLGPGNNSLTVTLFPHCNSPKDCDADQFCAGLVSCSGFPQLNFGACTTATVDAGLAPKGAPCGHCAEGYCSGSGAGICMLSTCNCAALLSDGGLGYIVDPTRGQLCNGASNSDTRPDACRTNCQPANCGDGVLDTGEVCDFDAGHNGTGVGCNDTCDLLGQVSTLAGSNLHPGFVDGQGTAASFGQPYGLAMEDGGNVLYVADISYRALRAIYLDTSYVQTIAGGHGTSADSDGPSTQLDAGFSEPLALIPFDGGLLVTDYGALRFFGFSPTYDGGTLWTFSGTKAVGSAPAAGFDAGPFDQCIYGEPRGIAQVGTQIFTDTTINGVLAVSDFATQTLTPVGGLGPIVEQGGLAALSGVIYTVNASSAGNLYHYDTLNTDAGLTNVGGGSGGGLALSSPDGICSDYSHSLYICETGDNVIRQYNVVTGRLSLLAGGNTPVPEIDGLGSQASFFDPAGCVFDPQTHTLYVSDKFGNTIRKIK